MNDNERPVILIDVDGVLDPDVTSAKRCHLVYHDGWVQRWVHVDGDRIRSLLNPAHGAWLRNLAAETGAELAWGTSWNEWANIHIAPVLMLPRLPVAPCPLVENLPFYGYPGKDRTPAMDWVRGRPVVWLDDAPITADFMRKLARPGQRHYAVHVAPGIGLTKDNVAEARLWLSHLAVRG